MNAKSKTSVDLLNQTAYKKKTTMVKATKFIKHALTFWNGVTFDSWADDCQNKKIIVSSQLYKMNNIRKIEECTCTTNPQDKPI